MSLSALTIDPTASSTAISERQRLRISTSDFACWLVVHVRLCTQDGSSGPMTPTFGERGGE